MINPSPSDITAAASFPEGSIMPYNKSFSEMNSPKSIEKY
jgi:hypothetical protein